MAVRKGGICVHFGQSWKTVSMLHDLNSLRHCGDRFGTLRPSDQALLDTRSTLSPPLEISSERVAAGNFAHTAMAAFGQQHPDGYWVGELEGDTILESEYILLLAFLGQETRRWPKSAAIISREATAEGGWAQYPGGESISAAA